MSNRFTAEDRPEDFKKYKDLTFAKVGPDFPLSSVSSTLKLNLILCAITYTRCGKRLSHKVQMESHGHSSRM